MHHFVLPTGYGNPIFVSNNRLLKLKKDKVKIIFLGSSRSFRGVDPGTVQKVLKQKYNQDLETMNISTPGIRVMEGLYLLDHLVEQNSNKVILFEVMERVYSDKIGKESTRLKYFLDYKWYQKSKLALHVENLDDQGWEENINWLNYLAKKNIIPIGQFETLFESIWFLFSPKETQGYEPFIEEKVLTGKNKSVFRRYSRLRSNLPSFDNAIKQHNQIIGRKARLPESNQALKKYYLEIIQKAKKKNVTILFYLPPMIYHRTSMIALYNDLPAENKIPMLDLRFLKNELFKMENWLDTGHLLEPGSKKYSSKLGTQIGQHLEKYQISIN